MARGRSIPDFSYSPNPRLLACLRLYETSHASPDSPELVAIGAHFQCIFVARIG